MNRRGFLAGAAPWVCTTAGVLMPVRQIVVPDRPWFKLTLADSPDPRARTRVFKDRA